MLKASLQNIFICIAVAIFNIQALGQRLSREETYSLQESKATPRDALYVNQKLSASVRAKDVLKRLTFEEKLSLTGGYKSFCFPGIPRLGLRPATMADASQGIRLKTIESNAKSTSFPAMLALAATWNPEMAAIFGKSIGEECRAHGVDILLGPGINMQRLSVGGRNYEYLGEDPLLTSDISVAYINGLQSQNIMATAKHFIGNDQEFCRHIASMDIDERTLREIYLPPWEAAIKKAGLKAIMTGNNAVNGIPAAVHQPLLKDILRNEYDFQGIAMTDWQNTNYHPNLQYLVAESGESLLMPQNKTFRDYVEAYVKKYPDQKQNFEAKLDQMIYPNLFTLFETGIYDRRPADPAFLNRMEEHKIVSRQCAEEAICLLKNENNILPISLKKKILLTGKPETFSGTGSGFVEGYDHTDFAGGLKKMYKGNFNYVANPTDEQIKNADIVLYSINKEGGEGYDVPFTDTTGDNRQIDRLTRLNKNVIVLLNTCNGLPMPWLPKVKGLMYTFFLGQERGNALANIVSGKVNPSGKLPFTIEHDFKDSPDPDFNYLGGKPYWYGANNYYKDYWMGKDTSGKMEISKYILPHQFVHVPYNEELYIGYRWYDKNKKEVLFPFGFGLSYTDFSYSNLRISSQSVTKSDPVQVSIIVKNTGKKAGAEVVQLYVSDKECSVTRPIKELKGFRKIYLNPGKSQEVKFTITPQDLAFWDIKSNDWKVEPGDFEVMIGKSAGNILLSKTFQYQ